MCERDKEEEKKKGGLVKKWLWYGYGVVLYAQTGRHTGRLAGR